MEFQEYVRQRNRMFDSMGRKSDRCIGVDCDICHNLTEEENCFEDAEIYAPEKAEAIVQKWADEHPVMTNAQMFEKVFGYKPFNIVIGSLPCPPHSRIENCVSKKCSDCLKWWDEEYKEQTNE